MFSSHPWGDLCPLKKPCEVQVCSAAAPGGPCWSPFGARGALPTEGDHFQLFFLLGYKGWLHLVHFNEQPLFAQVQAGGLCAELQPNERGEKSPFEVERQNQENPGQKGFRRVEREQRAPARGQSPSSPQQFPCWMWIPRCEMFQMLWAGPIWGCPQGLQHPQGWLRLGVKCSVQFCFQVYSVMARPAQVLGANAFLWKTNWGNKYKME